MNTDPLISIVVPLFNESENISYLKERLNKLLALSEYKIEIVLVDDGSKDDTATQIETYALENDNIQSISLSRNFGHQTAVTAGIANAQAVEAIMIIDGDLQDPPELLTEFYKKLKEGYEVVYGIRKKRKESFYKKLSYKLFYRIQKSLVNIPMPLDAGDFCMISRNVADIMISMPEESRFLRGMRAWVGFEQAGIEYERNARYKGDSKYSLAKLFKLAYNGIFNFSEFPIKMITTLGILSVSVALVYLVYNIIRKLFYHDVPIGFTALLMAIIMFSGVQMLSIGIIGEYVSRIFFQVKNRPLFIIKKRILSKKIAKNDAKLELQLAESANSSKLIRHSASLIRRRRR